MTRARTFVVAEPSVEYTGSVARGLEIGLPSGGTLALSDTECTRLLVHRQRQRLRVVPPLRCAARRVLDGPAMIVPRLPASGWTEAVNVPFRRSLWRLRPYATDEEACCLAAILHAAGTFARPLEPLPDATVGFLESLVGRRAILESRQHTGLVVISDLTLRARDADDWLVLDLLAPATRDADPQAGASGSTLRIDHVRVPDLCDLRGGSAVSRHGAWALHMDPARVARWDPLAAARRRSASSRRSA